MSEEISAIEFLPLLFTTALVVYVLAMGSADLARSVIRVSALFCAAFCLAVWGMAALSYESWGQAAVDDFYAIDLIARHVGTARAGWLLLAGSLLPVGVGLHEMRRLQRRRAS